MRRQLTDKNTLTGKASRALGWSFGSTLLNKVGTFGIGVMLARLLGPHAFGTYAVAYVALMALLNFNELGVSLAIVRWPGDPAGIVPTVTTISIFVSVVIYTGCFFGAPAYASAMGAPTATGVIRVLALAVLIDAFTNTPAALLQRNFRQGQRTISDQVNLWVGTGLTVALAWSGFGPMSLAIGRVIGCAVGAVMLLAFAPESLRLGFNVAKARALLRFGLPLAGANLIGFAVACTDQIIVGHVLGTVALGFYVLALNLSSWPLSMFSQPVRTVGPAVFSRLQHDAPVMRSTFISTAGLLCAVALPVCLLIGGSARPLISFVYGARWMPSARPLVWLALLGAVQVFFLLAYDYLVVLARSRFLLITQIVWLLALVPALIVGARADGIYGASLAEFAVAALCILPWYLIELSRAGIRLTALSRSLGLPLAGATVTGTAALAAARVAPSPFPALVASGLVTMAVVGLLGYRMRTVFAQLRSTSAKPVAASSVPPRSASRPQSQHDAGTSEMTGGGAAIPAVVTVTPATTPVQPRRAHDSWPALLAFDNHPAGPPSAYRDILAYPTSRHDPSAVSPLYHATVAALRWDPANCASEFADDSSSLVATDMKLRPHTAQLPYLKSGRVSTNGRRIPAAATDMHRHVTPEE